MSKLGPLFYGVQHSLRGQETKSSAQKTSKGLFLSGPTAAATPSNRFLGPFAGAGVCLCSLATNRQVTAMAQPTVTANFHQTLDVHLILAAQITFELIFLDMITHAGDLSIRQILHPGIRVNPGRSKSFQRPCAANAKNISQTNFNALIAR